MPAEALINATGGTDSGVSTARLLSGASANINHQRNDDFLAEIRKFKFKHAKNMIIAHYNINSIRNKFTELRRILDIDLCHILAISETKLDASFTSSQFQINHCKMYRKNRDKHGGAL